ncbi:hypothetical protein ABIC89_001059 [Variovorax boronicumulans]|jgi:hypothetical protein|uniref:hypothetical protein n=1 Tax=Variovorax boronicumulans TaxID=436515 RepID=UPI0033993C3D
MPRGIPNSSEAPQIAVQQPALKKHRITFHGQGAPVEIGHNYKINAYPRNIPTTIDENFLDALRHAVTHTRVQDEEGNWSDVSIPTYQYTLEAA